MISPNATRDLSGDFSAKHHADAPGIVPAWDGILHEFRNHLTVLLAATTELHAEIPPALSLRVGDAVFETERSVQGLTSLVAMVDASLRLGEPVIATLGEVVDRAVRLASPGAGRRTTVTAHVPRGTGVRTRGAALESLLAALIIDLARATDGTDASWARRVRIDAYADRRGLVLEVASDGARPDAGSWRFRLAADLAAKLDATLARHPHASAFVVQIH